MQIPDNVINIPRQIDAIGDIDSDQAKSLDSLFKDGVESALGQFDQADLTSIPLNPTLDPDTIAGNLKTLVQDGGDTYYDQARAAGEAAFNKIKEELFDGLDSLVEDNKNTLLNDDFMGKFGPAASTSMGAMGINNVNVNDLKDKVKEGLDKLDIKLLIDSMEQKSNEQKADLIEVGQDLLDQVNTKTQEYATMAGTFTAKMEDLKDKVIDMDLSRLGTSLTDLTDSPLDAIEGLAGEELMNFGLQAGLTSLGVPPAIAGQITVNDVRQIESVLGGKLDIRDAAGNIALDKIPGTISSQDASKFAKSVRDQLGTSGSVISGSSDNQKILNGSTDVIKNIQEGKDFFKQV